MPNWTDNKLTVTGERRAVDAFLSAVGGTAENGEPKPLSLNAIDPMPPQYKNGVSWGDSEEYAALEAEFKSLPSEQKMPFLHANPGFQLESMERIENHPTADGWYSWRVQHWGTKWDLDDEVMVEISEDGTEVRFDFDSANGDIAPAIATAARRFPDLSFALCSQHEFEDEAVVRNWREGREVSV
jgi:hypothetical protein